MMKRRSYLLALAVVVTGWLVSGVTAQGAGRIAPVNKARTERWSPEKIQKWYAQQEWLVGANFLPSTAINQVEMWDAETFDTKTIQRELALAHGLGFNIVRVYLHDTCFEKDGEGLMKRMDQLLDLCKANEIKPLFVFFDDCWLCPSQVPNLVPEPRPGTHNSGWLQSPGQALVRTYPSNPVLQKKLKKYVQTVLRRFAQDERILGWDLYNEPGNRASVRFDEQGEEIPGEKRAKPTLAGTAALLNAAYDWAWEVNPSQPLTSGIWEKSKALKEIRTIQLTRSDLLSFHCYNGGGDIKEYYIPTLAKNAPGRPAMCTEYMARSGSTFVNDLPVFKEHNIGAINWGLVSGKSQTIYGWGTWKKPGPTPEPEKWFHDILRPDGSAYNPAEVKFIREITDRKKASK